MEHKDYRQDERKEAAFQRYENERDKDTFVQGAAWADEHPKRGMVNIEEVIDWLVNNWEDYAYDYGIDDAIYSLRLYFKHK